MSMAPRPHTSTPGWAVDELAAERVAGPSFGVDGDDVGVAHQAQARRARFAAFHACDERDPARGRLEAGHVEAGVAEERVERVGVAMLEARARRAVVDAAVADHRLQQLDGLSSDRGRCHTRSSSRRPSRRWPRPSAANADTVTATWKHSASAVIVLVAFQRTRHSPRPRSIGRGRRGRRVERVVARRPRRASADSPPRAVVERHHARVGDALHPHLVASEDLRRPSAR